MLKNIVLVFLSAGLFYLSGPKADLYILAWIAFVPLLYVLYKSDRLKTSFIFGYIFGVFFYLLIYFWINGLNKFVGILANIGWIIQALVQGLYFGLFAVLFYCLKKEKNIYLKFLAIPSLWVFIEFLMSLVPFGITVNIGYSQRFWVSLLQICSVTGVLGITFLIILFNALILLMFFEKNVSKKQGFYLVLVFACIIFPVLFYGNYRLRSENTSDSSLKKIRIAIIQPNFSIEQKILHRNHKFMKEQCFAMTKAALEYKPDIIIWPETAILPILMLENKYFINDVNNLLEEKNVVFISGTWRRQKGSSGFYNSSLVMERGSIAGWQDKTHLIPFGEYLPLRSLFIKIPLFGKSPYFSYDLKAVKEIKAIETSKANIGILICVDSVFPETVKKFVKKGSNLIITITNDSWFGRSTALYQHILCGYFRAVENKVNFIQVANTGISAVIDQYGRMQKISKVDSTEIILHDIYIEKTDTIFLKYGNYYLVIPFILIGLCLFRNNYRIKLKSEKIKAKNSKP